MENIKLKPCPFCGKMAHIIKTYCPDTEYTAFYVFHNCFTHLEEIKTKNYDTVEDAANAWNKRMEDI